MVIHLLSTFPSWVMVLKLSKKDLSKKPKSFKVLSCMLLKLYTLSENDRVYSGLSHHEILTIKIAKNANSAEIKENPSTSNPYISKIVCQSIISNTIFWKRVTRPFRCMYINCFNRLILLLQSAQICKKMHFFWQFQDHNSRREHEN